MDPFKINNFVREYPGTALPRCSAVGQDEVIYMASILRRADPCPGEPATGWLRRCYEASTIMPNVNLEEHEIPLATIFLALSVEPKNYVYLEWGALQNIDRFDLNDLEKYFYDIWYPGADDIELFDETFKWIIFIRHFGSVSIWRPESSLAVPLSQVTGR